jgi:hypothetical protein
MFKNLRAILVSILQMLLPPPSTLPPIKYYNTPDYDRLYFNDINNIKVEMPNTENNSIKNNRHIIE